MRKMILAALGASLIAASTVQIAAAAEHHDGRKAERATTRQEFRNDEFRNAYGSWAQPAQSDRSSEHRSGWYSDYNREGGR